MTVNQQEWLEALARFRDDGEPCCQVVVTGVKGSAPREVGARMIVSGGKLAWGTIGGGQLEHLAIQRATQLIAEGRAASLTEAVPLSEKAGQCCGGLAGHRVLAEGVAGQTIVGHKSGFFSGCND